MIATKFKVIFIVNSLCASITMYAGFFNAAITAFRSSNYYCASNMKYSAFNMNPIYNYKSFSTYIGGDSLISQLAAYNRTTVEYSILYNESKLFEYLSQTVPLDVYNDKGYKPLYYAVALGKSDMVDLLLKKGVSTKNLDTQGNNAEQVAARYKRENILTLLKKYKSK